MVKAIIFGVSGTELTPEELSFFEAYPPLGFILFGRNIESRVQLEALINSLKTLSPLKHVPILIDQEGGRVCRIKPPIAARHYPPAQIFSRLARYDMPKAQQAAYMNARLLANELFNMGITVNCAPVCDIAHLGTHEFLKDRCYGSDLHQVTALASDVAEGMKDSGVLPIIKHIPGHGPATSDSHIELPIVTNNLVELRRTDFAVFQALSHVPIAMTAHVCYQAIDPMQPATFSRKVIDEIRHNIGFRGLLLSDDICMQALQGSMQERARMSLAAGCDIVLHCNGNMEEMKDVAMTIPEFPQASLNELLRTMENYKHHRKTLDVPTTEQGLATLLELASTEHATH